MKYKQTHHKRAYMYIKHIKLGTVWLAWNTVYRGWGTSKNNILKLNLGYLVCFAAYDSASKQDSLLIFWFVPFCCLSDSFTLHTSIKQTFSDSFPANFHVLLVVLVHSGWLLHCRSAESSLPACCVQSCVLEAFYSWCTVSPPHGSGCRDCLFGHFIFHLSLLSDLNVIRKRKMKWKKIMTRKCFELIKTHKLQSIICSFGRSIWLRVQIKFLSFFIYLCFTFSLD